MARELLEKALAAHGGLARWNCFATVQATIVTGRQLFGMKGTPQDSMPRRMTVATQREWASVFPYGADDQRTDFTANRIAVEKLDGAVVKERLHPSEHAEGKAVDAPWDVLDRAYFNGYALCTYLTTPFHFAMPGFAVEEIYFGPDFLLRRHYYHVESSGGFASAPLPELARRGWEGGNLHGAV
jgi:hypothetical protein